MKFDILTLFPSIINSYTSESILKRASSAGLINVVAHNFREYADNKHSSVDDSPYGGGAGMILKVQPIFDCLKSINAIKIDKEKDVIKTIWPKNTKVLVMDPDGKKFDQNMAKEFSKLDRIVFICGRYQGFDERVYNFAHEKISVGDYVLSGGELPALTIVEAVSRLIPGVLGNAESLKEETFNDHLECPQYTRPDNFIGLEVPDILLSGDHQKIKKWRKNHN